MKWLHKEVWVEPGFWGGSVRTYTWWLFGIIPVWRWSKKL